MKHAIAFIALAGCASVPPALDYYSTTVLPKRNAGGYSTLIPELRAELVLQDATAACSVAVAKGADEATAPACVCSKSGQDDWESNCFGWMTPVEDHR